jgi:hypothetical protein
MAVVALGRKGAHHAGGGGAGAAVRAVSVEAEVPNVPPAAESWVAVQDRWYLPLTGNVGGLLELAWKWVRPARLELALALELEPLWYLAPALVPALTQALADEAGDGGWCCCCCC